MTIINNNGGWSFENSQSLAGIIDGLQTFVQHPLLAQLKEQLIKLKK